MLILFASPRGRRQSVRAPSWAIGGTLLCISDPSGWRVSVCMHHLSIAGVIGLINVQLGLVQNCL